VERITRLALPYQVAVATFGVAAVALFGGAMFGTPPFSPARAAAAVVDPLAAPVANANVVGVLAAPPAAEPAAAAVRRTLGRNWPSYRVVHLDAFAPSGDCAQAPVASVLRVSVERLGDVRDVGIELLDCGGWSVNQWHEQGEDVEHGARAALLRVRVW